MLFNSSAGNARNLLQECYTSQRVRSERDANFTNVMRADHEFYCSNTAAINHKVTRSISQENNTEIPHVLVSLEPHLSLKYPVAPGYYCPV